jgi:hypothetical protein
MIKKRAQKCKMTVRWCKEFRNGKNTDVGAIGEVQIRQFHANGVGAGTSIDERPGLFHSVALRPYHDPIPVMINLHFSHVMVGAQCNGVE